MLAFTLLLTAAPAARADTPPQYPDQRPIAPADLRAMVYTGVGFWAERYVTITGPVQLAVADDVGDAQDGLAESPFSGEVFGRSLAARDYGVNRIVFRSDWLRAMRREMRDPTLGRTYTAYVCAVVWHELGHIGGLANPKLVNGSWVDGHPATGLMSQQMTVPGDCRGLANQLARRPRAPRRRSSTTGSRRR
jgi:hypothetical protein